MNDRSLYRVLIRKGSCYRDGLDEETRKVNMNLADVLLILVAEAVVLLGIVALLRSVAEQDRVARCARNFARRARIVARRARERNNLPLDETTVTRLGAG